MNGKTLTDKMRATIEKAVDREIGKETVEGNDLNIAHHQMPITSIPSDATPPSIPLSPTVEKERSQYSEALRASYHIWRERPHTERDKLKTFALSKVNRGKIAAMNVALADLLETDDIVEMSDLNALHYTAARLLTGIRKPHDPTVVPGQRDPDHALQMKIRRTRQWIGRLTAVL